MAIKFSIDYFAPDGHRLVLQSAGDTSVAIDMTPVEAGRWEAVIDGNAAPTAYRYLVVAPDGTVSRSEWGKSHRLIPIGDLSCNSVIADRWQDIPADKPFYSQAFTRSIMRRPEEGEQPAGQLKPGCILISVDAPRVMPDETLVMAGDCDALGRWDPSRAPELNDTLFPTWQLSLPLGAIPSGTEYKAVVVKRADRRVVEWEQGANHRLRYNAAPGDAVAVNGLTFDGTPPTWRGAGVAIPIFSMRTNDDCGIGDFYDLIDMIDWAADTGQRFVQILPINDTTMTGSWTDSYPYNANTTFALHPMYLRLEAMGALPDPDRQRYYREQAVVLNKLPEVDYERVNRVKLEYMNELFDTVRDQFVASPDFKEFYNGNSKWLRPYAAFCVLRDIYRTADFSRWEQYADYSDTIVDSLMAEHAREVEFVYFQQFHLDRQLRHVRDHARSRGVAIKGDIPIGISRTSVDAWVNPRLFNLDCSAGAPPDDFAVLGQNWGFPTYNWHEMSLDNYAWWRARFGKMAEYFDAYRIDHVLGFFRIWEVPYEQIHGLLGTFNPALPLTAAEMFDRWQFVFDREEMTRPFISEEMLRPLFGEFADEVKSTCLVARGNGCYDLKPQYRSQRHVEHVFYSMGVNAKTRTIADGLLALLDEVLFIEDRYAPGHYHPRITGSHTAAYRALDEQARQAYDALYEDFYYHRHNEFWYHSAMSKLPALIEATDMLTCAEDLGMIPACVPEVMKRLEILTLEIQRMPKEFVKFGDPSRYPYLSVCTTSTHDMSGIRGWWEENREDTVAYYRDVLQAPGDAPHFAEPRVCRQIVKMHLDSPSMLCILPLQDWLSTDGRLRRDNPNDERINVPANSHQYWRYRMHLPIEELSAANAFNASIRKLIADSGR